MHRTTRASRRRMPGILDNVGNTRIGTTLALTENKNVKHIEREKSRPRKSPLPMEVETGDLDEKRPRVDEPVVYVLCNYKAL